MPVQWAGAQRGALNSLAQRVRGGFLRTDNLKLDSVGKVGIFKAKKAR